MRQMGKFNYKLKDENGYFIDYVMSGVKIREGDILGYKGNQLRVIAVSETELKVEKTGSYIVVE